MFNAVRAATVRARGGAGPAGGTRGGRPGPPASAGGRWDRLGAGEEGLGPRAISTSAKTGTPFARRARAGRRAPGRRDGGADGRAARGLRLAGHHRGAGCVRGPHQGELHGGRDLGGRDPRGPRLRSQQPHDGPPPPWRPSSDPVAGRRRPPSPPPVRPPPRRRGSSKTGRGGRGLAPQEAGEKAGGGGSPQPAGTHCLHTACTMPAHCRQRRWTPAAAASPPPARCPEG